MNIFKYYIYININQSSSCIDNPYILDFIADNYLEFIWGFFSKIVWQRFQIIKAA